MQEGLTIRLVLPSLNLNIAMYIGQRMWLPGRKLVYRPVKTYFSVSYTIIFAVTWPNLANELGPHAVPHRNENLFGIGSVRDLGSNFSEIFASIQ